MTDGNNYMTTLTIFSILLISYFLKNKYFSAKKKGYSVNSTSHMRMLLLKIGYKQVEENKVKYVVRVGVYLWM